MTTNFSQWLLVESEFGPEDTKALGRLMRLDPAWPVVANKQEIFKYVMFSYSGVYSKQRLEDIWKRYRVATKE